MTSLLYCYQDNFQEATGPQNFYRGGPLTTYDAETRQAITVLGDKIDAKTITEVWDVALASVWGNSPVWVHGRLFEQFKLFKVY